MGLLKENVGAAAGAAPDADGDPGSSGTRIHECSTGLNSPEVRPTAVAGGVSKGEKMAAAAAGGGAVASTSDELSRVSGADIPG